MAIAGGFAGLAGSTNLMGQPGYNLTATAFSVLPTGFDAIAVALLGQTTAIGILLASLLIGGLRSGSTAMQSLAHVDPNLVLIIEALVLFFIAAEFFPALRRILPVWSRPRFRPTLQAATIDSTVVGLPENGNGGVQNMVEISDLEEGGITMFFQVLLRALTSYNSLANCFDICCFARAPGSGRCHL